MTGGTGTNTGNTGTGNNSGGSNTTPPTTKKDNTPLYILGGLGLLFLSQK